MRKQAILLNDMMDLIDYASENGMTSACAVLIEALGRIAPTLDDQNQRKASPLDRTLPSDIRRI